MHYRSGFWRTSIYGVTHWVEGHWVDRNDWNSHQAPRTVYACSLDARHSLSYTNPNASCPVCGASVFFYQSPYGARVFFDELGPPWRKHPCTDNSNHYDHVVAPKIGQTSTEFRWQKSAWSPALDFKLSKVRSNVYQISFGKDPIVTVYFKCNSARLHKPPPTFAQFKAADLGNLQLSLYWLERGSKEFTGYKSPDEALLASSQ